MTAELTAVDPDDKFFKKLTLRLLKQGALVDLATACRKHGVLNGDETAAKKWVEDEYLPHLSLMYAELSKDEVAKRLDLVKRNLQETRRQLTADVNDIVAHGGVIVLVPTDKPISEWEPIARRQMPNVEWIWKESLFAQ